MKPKRTRKEAKLDGIGKYDQLERKQADEKAKKEFQRKPYSVNKKKD